MKQSNKYIIQDIEQHTEIVNSIESVASAFARTIRPGTHCHCCSCVACAVICFCARPFAIASAIATPIASTIHFGNSAPVSCCPCFFVAIATAIATAISFGTHESAPGTHGAAPDAATTGAIASGCHFCRRGHFCHFCRCCHVCHQKCSFLQRAEPGAETAEQVVCSLQEGCTLAAGSVRAM